MGILGACAGQGEQRQQAKPSTQPSKAREVTLAFGGDVHFEGRTRALLDRPEQAFGPIAEVLSKADLGLVNLETAVTERGTPEPKQFLFRAPASAYAAVKAAGVDAVSLANNHALDYGQAGLADTLSAAKQAGVQALGAGVDSEAYRPWVVEVNQTKLAVVALTHVNELWERWSPSQTRAGLAMLRDEERALRAVRQAGQEANVVVAWTHWGAEYEECPGADIKRLAGRLVEAGADLIVGGHQHLLLGAGWQGDAYVAYGLGNFLWWRNDAISNDTGVLWVTIRDGAVVEAALIPAQINRVTGQPEPAGDEAAQRIREDQVRLRECAGLSEIRLR